VLEREALILLVLSIPQAGFRNATRRISISSPAVSNRFRPFSPFLPNSFENGRNRGVRAL
jgi:hypothetical protein